VSFSGFIAGYEQFDLDAHGKTVTTEHIDELLTKPVCSPGDFASLLSDAATERLEAMAQKAYVLTRRHFGHAVSLFTPMYISNYCMNNCPYCSFASTHHITRSHLSIDEIRDEARKISGKGIRQVLILTGESPSMVPVSYLREAVAAVRALFPSVAIEVYPLTVEGYADLVDAGTDTLTLYQETYNPEQYSRLHTSGPKSDFQYRLDAPERGCIAGMHAVTVGALLGLYDWRYDVFATGLHAAYLMKKYPGVEIGVSFPRLRPQAGTFTPYSIIDDRHFVQMLTAMRIFLPSAGITISTRESASFRMSVLPLGVTRMSAGVSTSVGGHSGSDSTPQFEIADTRSVQAILSDLASAGFQPVLHDWNSSLVR